MVQQWLLRLFLGRSGYANASDYLAWREQLERLSAPHLQGSKKALRLRGIVLTVRCVLHRIRKPRFPTARGMLLLLIDQLGYELAPFLLLDKPPTFRQRLSRLLAVSLAPSPVRYAELVRDLPDAKTEAVGSKIVVLPAHS